MELISAGATVANAFNCKLEKGVIKNVEIVYKQGQHIVFTKTEKDIMYSYDEEKGTTLLTVYLNEKETARFDNRKGLVAIQIRVRYTDDRVVKSDVIHAKTDELLSEGVV